MPLLASSTRKGKKLTAKGRPTANATTSKESARVDPPPSSSSPPTTTTSSTTQPTSTTLAPTQCPQEAQTLPTHPPSTSSSTTTTSSSSSSTTNEAAAPPNPHPSPSHANPRRAPLQWVWAYLDPPNPIFPTTYQPLAPLKTWSQWASQRDAELSLHPDIRHFSAHPARPARRERKRQDVQRWARADEQEERRRIGAERAAIAAERARLEAERRRRAVQEGGTAQVYGEEQEYEESPYREAMESFTDQWLGESGERRGGMGGQGDRNSRRCVGVREGSTHRRGRFGLGSCRAGRESSRWKTVGLVIGSLLDRLDGA
ncbi:hypothetical protein B0J12DRAFT_767398 [Macrophomina phaseolina]|uniref:Uncharacterized protein n=1 Tax=Macrophomina phaseolina TaxID=35725 RepID=A0ABQ8FX71_9PEZI|nr:hypothetical protein B0J12DRAFT_767398 [Macrophomina phaseolina]